MLDRRVLLTATLVGLGSLAVCRTSINCVDPDLWHEMALAREIFDRGIVPLEDPFAYTPTLFPVVHHEWGAGVIAYLVAVTAGATGIVVAKYLLAFGLAAVCCVCACRRGAGFEVMSVLGPFAILLLDRGFSPIRAQMYSFLFTACLLYWLDRDREGSRWWLWIWLLAYTCWLNVHAGFLVGAGIYALYWLERFIRRERHLHLLLAGFLMVPLIAVNPYGTAYYAYLLRAVAMPRPLVNEWAPIWHAPPYQIVAFLLSLLLLAYVIWTAGVTKFRGLPIILVTAFLAVRSKRMVDFYAIAWICYVPAYFQCTGLGLAVRNVYAKGHKAVFALWTLVALVLGSCAVMNKPWQLRVPSYPVPGYVDYALYPVGAVDYLAENHFRGNLMVPFNHGSYVSWKLYPNVRVSVDSRYEVAYPSRVVDELYSFYMAKEDWEDTLSAYATDAVLLPKRWPLTEKMPQARDWRRVYADRYFDVYVKSTFTLPSVDRSAERIDGTFP